MKKKMLALSTFTCVILSAFFINAEPFKDEALGVEFPGQIGKLTFYGRKEYQQPGLGYSSRYDDQKLFKVDIYVYDKDLSAITEGTNSELVTNEFICATNDISRMEEIGKYKDVKSLDHGTTAYSKGSLQFLWHRCQYRQSGESVDYQGLRVSETYLSAKSGKFIKVRITVTEKEFTERKTEISNFMKDLAKILGKPKPDGGNKRDRKPQDNASVVIANSFASQTFILPSPKCDNLTCTKLQV